MQRKEIKYSKESMAWFLGKIGSSQKKVDKVRPRLTLPAADCTRVPTPVRPRPCACALAFSSVSLRHLSQGTRIEAEKLIKAFDTLVTPPISVQN